MALIDGYNTAFDQAQITGYLPEGVTEELEVFWDHQARQTWLACGDERAPTFTSAKQMENAHPSIRPPMLGYASIFGGAAGVADTIALAGTAEHGGEFIEQNGGLPGILEMAKDLPWTAGDGPRLHPIFHTAESNEAPSLLYCAHGKSPVGCAYCAMKGTITDLLIDSEVVRQTAQADQRHVFGDNRRDEALFGALETLRDHERQAAAPGSEYAIGRATINAYNKLDDDLEEPVMVLAGDHVSKAPFLASFIPRKIGSAAGLRTSGYPAFRADIEPVTAAISRKFVLNPHRVARAIVLMSTGVRGGLVAHSAKSGEQVAPDPRRIPMGALGDAQAAINGIAGSMRRFR